MYNFSRIIAAFVRLCWNWVHSVLLFAAPFERALAFVSRITLVLFRRRALGDQNGAE
jgi:hypothetical protein